MQCGGLPEIRLLDFMVSRFHGLSVSDLMTCYAFKSKKLQLMREIDSSRMEKGTGSELSSTFPKLSDVSCSSSARRQAFITRLAGDSPAKDLDKGFHAHCSLKILFRLSLTIGV